MNKVHDFSLDLPIDVKKAIEALGGEQKIFYSMLAKIESMSLNPSMVQMAAALDEKDYEQVKNKAHSLKGASGYIGASIVHYTCFQIQEAFQAEDYKKMIDYYPQLVEACIQFKIYANTLIAKH